MNEVDLEFARGLIGQQLEDGSCVVESILAWGGSSCVFQGWHRGLQRRVALKMLRRSLLDRPSLVNAALEEARVTNAVSSPYVVRLLGVGRSHGLPFSLLELVRGRSLQEYVRRCGPPVLEETLNIAYQLAVALRDVHACRIVHCDLKPHNVMVWHSVDQSSCVKLIDFGVAKRLNGAPIEGRWGGTPGYMAPEQIRAQPNADYRVDVWGLGITLYYLLAGTLPFAGVSRDDLVASTLLPEPIGCPRTERPIPRDVWQLVEHCLQKDPEARCVSMHQVAARLGELRLDGVAQRSMPARDWYGRQRVDSALVCAAPSQPTAYAYCCGAN